MSEGSLLIEAHNIITGERKASYGDARTGFQNIADQWVLYLRQKYKLPPFELSAEDICWMMADLKKVRQMNEPKRDNVVDAVGYIGLIEKVS